MKDTRPVHMGTYEIHKTILNTRIEDLRTSQTAAFKDILGLRNDLETHKSSIESKFLKVAVLSVINAIAILLQLIFG